MESNLNKLEVGVSHCVERAEFHFGKRRKRKPAYSKPDPEILQLFLWLTNIFIIFLLLRLSYFVYLPIIKPFRLKHIAKQISCSAVW